MGATRRFFLLGSVALVAAPAGLRERAGTRGPPSLDGRWGLEHLAIAVPKGRDAAAAYLRDFAESARREGRVRAAAERAGSRGIAELP